VAVDRVNTVIRVLVVDDHPAIVDALGAAAVGSGDVDVLGAAADGPSAATLIESLDPDVVICDLALLDPDGGLGLLRRFAGRSRPAFLLLSGHETPSLIRAGFDLGAAGYLSKTTSVDRVLESIRVIADGGTVFDADALRLVRGAPRRPSDRETEVIALVVGGATNAEIGGALGVSERTVESHLRRLFDRYGVLSRTELAVLALEEGWVARPTPTP
jgi:DNA-binding NarL/FixJ family response regulator